MVSASPAVALAVPSSAHQTSHVLPAHAVLAAPPICICAAVHPAPVRKARLLEALLQLLGACSSGSSAVSQPGLQKEGTAGQAGGRQRGQRARCPLRAHRWQRHHASHARACMHACIVHLATTWHSDRCLPPCAMQSIRVPAVKCACTADGSRGSCGLCMPAPPLAAAALTCGVGLQLAAPRQREVLVGQAWQAHLRGEGRHEIGPAARAAAQRLQRGACGAQRVALEDQRLVKRPAAVHTGGTSTRVAALACLLACAASVPSNHAMMVVALGQEEP